MCAVCLWSAQSVNVATHGSVWESEWMQVVVRIITVKVRVRSVGRRVGGGGRSSVWR